MRSLDEGRVWRPAPLHSVSIVGMGLSAYSLLIEAYREYSVLHDPGHQVWTVNSTSAIIRNHVAFDLHNLPEMQKTLSERDWENCKHLYAGLPFVVTLVPHPDVPNSMVFPIKEVVETFQETYFDNSVAYIIAAAMLSGAKTINMYGCDYNYAGRNEYEVGRCCVEYWLGRARGEGIQIKIANSSTLLSTKQRLECAASTQADDMWPMYGYGQNFPITELVDGKAVVKGLNAPPEFEDIEDSIQNSRGEGSISEAPKVLRLSEASIG